MHRLDVLQILAKSDPRVFAEAIQDYGLKVIGLKNDDPLETRVQVESIRAIASALTEDADENVDLHPAQLAALRLAEENGYVVKIISEMPAGAPVKAPPQAPPQEAPAPGRAPAKPGKKKRRQPFNPTKPKVQPKPKACGGRMRR